MGVRLARLFRDCGHRVLLGSRERTRARGIAERIGGEIHGVEYAEAVQAEIVLPALFLRDGLLEVLEPYREDLEDKILIDITNPFNETYDDFILPWDTSGAEHLQCRFPRARIVGAFKNVWWEVFDQPRFDDELSDVFVVSDDTDAKRRFFALVEGSPFRYVDAGRLANARFIERMTLLIAELGRRYEYFPRMNWRLLGKRWVPGQADDLKEIIARA
jgi:predicted dinucleotide-binding enzyme